MIVESAGRCPPVASNEAGAAEQIVAGDILVMRGLLQSMGWFDRLVEVCRRHLIVLVGTARADEVVAAHFERIHEQLSVGDLFSFNRGAMRDLARVAPRLIRDFSHNVLQRDGTFAECYPNLRTIVPYDIAAQDKAAFAAEHRSRGAGKVTLHGPHYDSWHRHPLNTINLWCAISHVREGNGMVVYPDVWGKNLPCDPAGRIRRDQILGRRINFALEPGDGVVFLANHLHGSEINRTAQTRCVISMRMTLEQPDFPGDHVYPYVYSDWVGGRLERYARLRVQLSRGFIRDRIRRLLTQHRTAPGVFVVGPQRRFMPTHDTSGSAPEYVPVSWDDSAHVCLMAANALPKAAIRPVNDRFCVAHTAAGYRLFERSCPHQGADLAGGSISRQGSLVCPWHNLYFDADTGMSPCRSIPRLGVTSGVLEGDTVRFPLSVARG